MNELSLPISNSNKNKIRFTNDQDVAIKELLSFIDGNFDESKYIIGLTGPAGTGKTFVIKYVINKCSYSPSTIAFAASTHKSCRVLSNALDGRTVNTIQSTFGFRLDLNLEDFDPENPQFNPKAKHKLDNKYTLIIDECSMLNANIVKYIEETCKNRKIKIIYIGDESQLPPVNERCSTAFNHCYKILRLKEIVRQNTTNPVNKLLNILRNDINYNTFDFINVIERYKRISPIYYETNELGEGFTICGKERFKELIIQHFNDKDFTKDIDKYRLIAYTKNNVRYWNYFIRNNIVLNSEKSVLTKNDLLLSKVTIVNDFLEITIQNGEEYIIHEIFDFVDSKYNLTGFLVRLQAIHGGNITEPLFIINHADINSAIKYNNILDSLKAKASSMYGNGRAAAWKEYFNFKNKYLLITDIVGKDGKIKYSGDLDYGFALTAHRAQGSTYKNAFIDLKDILYDKSNNRYTNIAETKRLIYTAISRLSKELFIYYD